ncbi:MAG: hypothetical protein ABR881_18890 [Candidatus Sulfotelmatobacter sp.]|jgi:hypothetical protein
MTITEKELLDYIADNRAFRAEVLKKNRNLDAALRAIIAKLEAMEQAQKNSDPIHQRGVERR